MMHNAQKWSVCYLLTRQALISCAFAQADLGLLCLLTASMDIVGICQQMENVPIRLHGCACSSGHSLLLYGIRAFFSCRTSNDSDVCIQQVSVVHTKKFCILGYPEYSQGRFRSDCAHLHSLI